MRMKHFTGAYVSVAVILLSCLGAISVGFATWVISQGDISTTTADIDADKVNTNINGLSITPSCFTMGHYHYENVDNASVSHSTTGTLSYAISIDKDALDKSIISNNTLTLSMVLTFADSTGANLPIFRPSYIDSVTYNSNSLSGQYTLTNPYKSLSLTIGEDVSGTGTIEKTLSFVFNQQLVARYSSAMRGGKFYLSVEAD